MKKILSLLILFSLLGISNSTIQSCKDKAVEVVKEVAKSDFTYLICGVDDAAENTDVILLVNYNSSLNRLSFIHIPRDTYFRYGDGINKINGYVPSHIKGDTDIAGAMSSFTLTLSRALGIQIDGYASYTTEAVSRLIDTVGGVELVIPKDIVSTDEKGKSVTISEGRHLLYGSEAIAFLRYRQGYTLGDLGRIDAQKIFLSSLISKMKKSITPELLFKLALDGGDGVTTNLNVLDLLNLAVKNRGRIKDLNVCFSNLPGRALTSSSNISYYSVNKKASEELLANIFPSDNKNFDAMGLFMMKNQSFKEIYLSEKIDYKIYSVEDLAEMKLLFN